MRPNSNGKSIRAESSADPFEKEAAYVVQHIDSVRMNWKEASIITVIRDRCIPTFLKKYDAYRKKHGTNRNNTPPILYTSETQLSDAANTMKAKREHTRTWVIIVSGAVPGIVFDINADIDHLRIARVNKVDPEENLLVSGDSTWNGTRIDRLARDSHRNHQPKLTWTKRVVIQPEISGSGSSWSTASSDSYNENHRAQAWSQVRRMPTQKGDWWEKAKGPITALLALSGLAIGSFKASTGLTCSPKGVFFSLKAGPVAIKVGCFSCKLFATLKLAASPVAAGVAAAALVYFVPWKKFLRWLGGWLKSICSSIWDMICSLWNSFYSNVMSWIREEAKDGFKCKCGGL